MTDARSGERHDQHTRQNATTAPGTANEKGPVTTTTDARSGERHNQHTRQNATTAPGTAKPQGTRSATGRTGRVRRDGGGRVRGREGRRGSGGGGGAVGVAAVDRAGGVPCG